MSKKIIRNFLCGIALFLGCNVIYAQDGAYNSYSPYSIFGVGDLSSRHVIQQEYGRCRNCVQKQPDDQLP